MDLQIRVIVNYAPAERFWEWDQPALSSVHISANVNIVGVEPKKEKLVVPFVVTIGYTHSVAQINIKGQAVISDNSDEIDKVQKSYNHKKAPSQMLLQTIASTSLIETTVVSRSSNIPPPIPLPRIPTQQKVNEGG